MKLLKKTAGILLALAMLLATAVTAFADTTTGSITVDNPQSDQTYTAYRIFDVVYNTGKDAYAYTIQGTDQWFTTVQAYATAEANGLTLTQIKSTGVYNVTIDKSKFSAPSFALALKAAVDGKTGTALTASEETVSVTGLPLGYYFVTSSTGALCNLTTTNPSVTIHDKNDIPFDKTDDKESVDVGEVVTYTVTGKVPDYTGFTSYTYLITDTMSKGLTFKKDVKVTVGGTDVTADCAINYNVDGNANKFTVSIPVLDKKYDIGAAIVVTYTAVVNEDAVGKVEKNCATLTYSNNPTNSSEKQTKGPEEETVYTAKLVIDKHVEGADATKLAGAKFVLYYTDENVNYYYKWNDTEKKVEWVTDKTSATVKTTDANGAASFDGLADRNYYLEETEAPTGYNMLTAPVPVSINGTATGETGVAKLTVTASVGNQTGAQLPATGGIGTTIFYVVGGVLVVGAAVVLITRKRMER